MNKLKEVAHEIFVMDDFLSKQECQKIISNEEEMNFTSADIDTIDGKKVNSYIRNNERADLFSYELAEELWTKLGEIELPIFDYMNAIALSPFFRFYKYSTGEKFNMHKDAQQRVGENITYYTFMVYLNDDFEGGNTVFQLNEISIKPKEGMLLVFQHRLWHQGEEVFSGNKYVLRTDVVYETINFETYVEREKKDKELLLSRYKEAL